MSPASACPRGLLVVVALAVAGTRAFGQHEMHATPTAASSRLPDARSGSGTAWLPDSASAGPAMRSWGGWNVGVAGSAFVVQDEQDTKRGDHQLVFSDWEMAMAMRPLVDGRLSVHAMTSLEPFVLGGNGYPLLLQTGGTYRHAVLHDRQHPPTALMELSARYVHPALGGAWSVYVGAVGEPASGPVTYTHRPSAVNDPLAPISHHWQDAAHQSFGVVTLGVSAQRWQMEGSLFNARETDEHHPVADFRGARLDSYAGRISWAATPRLLASAWWAFLNAHERLDPTTRMHQFGVAALAETRGPGGGRWSSTVVFGVNVHHHGAGSHLLLHGGPGASPHHRSGSVLAETNLALGGGAVFARAERVQKNGEELGFAGGDLTALYDVRSLVLGGEHHITSFRALALSLGMRGAVNAVPATLLATYGTRHPTSFAVYGHLQLRTTAAHIH